MGLQFALEKSMEVAKGLLPTGLDFGPDGALYFADWIDGWGIKENGRLWKLDVPNGFGYGRKTGNEEINRN